MAEKVFQEEKAALQLQHNEELRQLRSQALKSPNFEPLGQVAASQDEQEVSRTEHETELERLPPVSTGLSEGCIPRALPPSLM